MKLCLGAEFPKQPPRAFFLTKIFHPNIAATGDVCVNTLKRDWDPQNWSLGNIFQVVRCLLIVPFPESALNEEAGRLFMESYADYAAHAAMINRVHAIPSQRHSAMPGESCDGEARAEEAEMARRKTLKQVQKTRASLKRL